MRIFTLLIFFTAFHSISQNLITKDSLNARQIVDSLFVDRDLNNWSVRLYSNIKAQRFKLSSDEAHLNFTPNNPYGIGVGVATSKLILDIGYNLKSKKEEETDRFDLQAGFFLKKNVINFFVQVYEGFNMKNSIDNRNIFRNDIKSIGAGIDYLYLTKRKGFSTNLLRSGLKDPKQSNFSFGLGGFLLFNQVSADKSIVPSEYHPYFNEQSRLIDFTNYGFGLMGGILSVFSLPSNFYLALSSKAGAGIAFQNKQTENLNSSTNTSGIYNINASALLGYKWKRFYINFSVNGTNYWTNIGSGNRAAFAVSRAKVAIGYRIRKN